VIPEYFEFQNSAKLISGKDAIAQIPFLLKELGCRKPLILTDSTLVKLGLAKKLTKSFAGSGYTKLPLFDQIPPDPPLHVVEAARDFFNQHGCDGIIALGGGSVLDTAKGLMILLSGNHSSLKDRCGYETLKGKSVPFIAVPTTSGTGSEATSVSVISDPDRKIKMEFISYLLLPHAAVLDPEMTLKLPPKITAAGAVDALVHAIEAFSGKQKNPLSRSHAQTAMELISENLIPALEHGDNRKIRHNLAVASFCAGAAFSNSMVGAVHAIGHSVGAEAHVPHGEAMAILLLPVMRQNLPQAAEDYSKILLHFCGAEVYAATEPQKRAEKLIEELDKWLEKVSSLSGIHRKLSKTSMDESHREKVIEKALNDGAILTNPVSVDQDFVEKILDAVW